MNIASHVEKQEKANAILPCTINRNKYRFDTKHPPKNSAMYKKSLNTSRMSFSTPHYRRHQKTMEQNRQSTAHLGFVDFGHADLSIALSHVWEQKS